MNSMEMGMPLSLRHQRSATLLGRYESQMDIFGLYKGKSLLYIHYRHLLTLNTVIDFLMMKGGYTSHHILNHLSHHDLKALQHNI